MPLFSVIIPAYNRGGLIAATLDSVLAQDSSDHEIIVVDDGSTDETLAVVARYGQRVKVLQQKNQGPGAARNLGIQQAAGEYVAFLDSDDLWVPWTLATYRQVIETCDGPAFVSGCPFWFREEAELAKIARGELRVERYADFLASSRRGLYFGASWFLVQREALLAAGGFTPRWINAEDHDLGLRLGTARGFVKIESPTTFAFRRHPDTAWANTTRSYQGYCHLVEQEKAGRYSGGAERKRERRRIITQHTRSFSLGCLRGGEASWGWHLYRATFSWQLALGRFRYLLGFPLTAAGAALRGKRRVDPADHP